MLIRFSCTMSNRHSVPLQGYRILSAERPPPRVNPFSSNHQRRLPARR